MSGFFLIPDDFALHSIHGEHSAQASLKLGEVM